MKDHRPPYGFNTAGNVFNVAANVLSARIALAKNDKQTAVEFFKKAVEVEDSLNYDEPEDWYIPVRESLGGILIISGNYAEAETVFRAELKKHPRNGRALFGLIESLKKQNKTAAAQFVQREFDVAWKNADSRLYPWASAKFPVAVLALLAPVALALVPQAKLPGEPSALAPSPPAVPGVLPAHTNCALTGAVPRQRATARVASPAGTF